MRTRGLAGRGRPGGGGPETISIAAGGSGNAGEGAEQAAGPAEAKLPLRMRLRRVAVNVAWAFGLFWSAGRSLTAGIILLTLLSGVLPAATMKVTQRMIEVATNALRRGVSFEAIQDRIVALLAVLLALFMLQHALLHLQRLAQKALGDRATFELNTAVLRKGQQIDFRRFDDPAFYDSLQRAQREASIRPALLIQIVLELVRSLVTVIAFLVLLAEAHWSLPLVLAAAAVPSGYVAVRFGMQRFALMNWRTPEGRRLTYLANLMTDQKTVKELRLFRIADYLIGQYRALFHQMHAEEMQVERRRALASAGAELVRLGGYLFGYALLIWSLFARQITLGAFVILIQVIARTQNVLDMVFRNGGEIFEQALFVSDVAKFLTLEEPRRGAGAGLIPAGNDIEARDVTFRYPQSPKPALEGVSFHIGRGEKIAIVGGNGAGKTTLVKLITGLYAPDQGELLIGGVRVDQIDPDALSDRVSVIFQDFIHYWLTVQENIGFGHLPSLEDAAAIERAAVRAGAAGFIKRLPQGYAAKLGRLWDGGVELSQGQWQKIALARAFIRPAEILVLDEPTSALDPRAEAELFETFAQLSKGKTTIFISHRIGTARLADRIFVMMEGKLVEQGTHDDLLAQGGEYARLFQLQAQWYV
jgi:ABC-type multidrug transport system fused ATPase/permease subunit